MNKYALQLKKLGEKNNLSEIFELLFARFKKKL